MEKLTLFQVKKGEMKKRIFAKSMINWRKIHKMLKNILRRAVLSKKSRNIQKQFHSLPQVWNMKKITLSPTFTLLIANLKSNKGLKLTNILRKERSFSKKKSSKKWKPGKICLKAAFNVSDRFWPSLMRSMSRSISYK